MRRRSESAQPGQLESVIVADADAVQEGGLCRGPEVPVDQVAGFGYHGGRYEQDLVVPAEPPGALCVVLVPAIGQSGPSACPWRQQAPVPLSPAL